MAKILQVKNVTKHYGGAVVTKALDNVTFEISSGEFVAMMGPSGSGKSTLLSVIATIDSVSSGDILLDGVSLAGRRESELAAFRREKLGFVFQEYNLLDTLTVAENITLPLDLMRVPVREAKEKLDKIAATLDIKEQLDKFPHELSGGQRQRAACARAVITSPSLVLADEPTGALDSKNSRLLMNTFELLNKSLGSTILTVTHDATVASYADRTLFLKDGRIWCEVVRGERTRREFLDEILVVSASLGGESDAR